MTKKLSHIFPSGVLKRETEKPIFFYAITQWRFTPSEVQHKGQTKKLSHIFLQAITQWRFTPSGVLEREKEQNLAIFSFMQSRSGLLPPAKYNIKDEIT